MRDFVKPILRRNPDKLVLHVRTNDLRHNEPKAVADDIANLVLKIKQQCSNVQVAVSGIGIRTDDTSMADRVRETNCMLKSLYVTKMAGILYLILMLRPFIRTLEAYI